jgi:hypothetical protein
MENQQPLWQKHLLLIVGVALPFALMAFVLIYQALVIAAVPMPKYAAVFAVRNGAGMYYPGTFKTDIENQHLAISYSPPTDEASRKPNATNPPKLALYLQDDWDKPAKRFDVQVDGNPAETVRLKTPDALNVPLIPGSIAPDNYQYATNYNYSSGLFTEIFVGGSDYRWRHMIHNSGRSLRLQHEQQYYADVDFIGWVAEPVVK